MTTINDIPPDVIAAHMASRLPLGSLNCLMRSSRRFEVICKNDEFVWAPMVRALFLKKQGTHYETVRDFHVRFNAFTDQQLSQPEPVNVFARIGNWLNNLWSYQAPPPKKRTLFEANIERWRSAQSLCQCGAYMVTSPFKVNLAITFQLYRIDPNITHQIQFCLEALEKGYLSQVAWFLENQLIPVNEQSYLLMKAVELGDLKAVNMLLEVCQISERERFEIMGRIKECNAREEIIKKLQQDTKLTDELRGAVLIGASTVGNLENVKKMLEMGPLPLECIVRAYYRANYAHAYSRSNSAKCGVIMHELRERSPELDQRLVPYEQEVPNEHPSPHYAIYLVFKDLNYQELGNEEEQYY